MSPQNFIQSNIHVLGAEIGRGRSISHTSGTYVAGNGFQMVDGAGYGNCLAYQDREQRRSRPENVWE